MAVISGRLGKTSDDALHMQTDEVVDDIRLRVAILMTIGADDTISCPSRLILNTVSRTAA